MATYQHYNIPSVDGMLSFLVDFADDPYIKWLLEKDFPPKSYRQHPINSENELNHYKKFFLQNFKISLGAFIRIKRVFYILKNSKDKQTNELSYAFISTPIGLMIAITSSKGLCLLEFLERKMLETEINELIEHFQSNLIFHKSEIHNQLEYELSKYFNKKLEEFSTPLDMVGTDFQIKVWEQLTKIKYGDIVSYSQQSTLLGIPNSVRAVASANGKNKISILIPCHRVTRKNGDLGGYGGGIYRKKYLINLENYKNQYSTN